MKLQNESFNLIRDGHKTIEVRLNDEKRKLLQVGDIVEFTNVKTDEKIKVRVSALLPYDTFKQLFNARDVFEFGSNSKEVLLADIYNFYKKEKEDECGVLGIKIEAVD